MSKNEKKPTPVEQDPEEATPVDPAETSPDLPDKQPPARPDGYGSGV